MFPSRASVCAEEKKKNGNPVAHSDVHLISPKATEYYVSQINYTK